jgi:hypothetical protein
MNGAIFKKIGKFSRIKKRIDKEGITIEEGARDEGVLEEDLESFVNDMKAWLKFTFGR